MSFSVFGNGQVSKVTSNDGSVGITSSNGDGTGEIDLSVIGGGGGSGVASFNTRTGAVTLLNTDIASALGAATTTTITNEATAGTSSLWKVRNANYSGGTPGSVGTALAVLTNVNSADAASYEWTILGMMQNHSAVAENVAIYGQGIKYSTGQTWAMVAEAQDMTNVNSTNSTGPLIGVEIDIGCNGTDTANSRIGIDLVVSNAQYNRGLGVGIGVGQAYAAIRANNQPLNGSGAGGSWYNGFVINSATFAGINNAANGVFGILHTGSYIVGIDLSNATHSSSAIRLKGNDSIALEATNAITMKYNTSTGKIEFYNGTTRRGYIDTTAGADVSFNTAGSGGGGGFTGNVSTDLTFTTAGTKIILNTSASSDLTTATRFVTNTTNLATGVVAQPNGTANTSSFIAVNSSAPTTGYQAVSYGMSGSAGLILSYGVGTSNPPINVQIGVGTTVAQFNASGLGVIGSLFLDAAQSVSMKYNSGTSAIEFYTGSTRKGYISLTGNDWALNNLSSGNITSALGYTPVNLAGGNTIGGSNVFSGIAQFNNAIYSLNSLIFGASTTASWVSTGNTYGSAGSLAGYFRIQIDGANYKVPYYNM